MFQASQNCDCVRPHPAPWRLDLLVKVAEVGYTRRTMTQVIILAMLAVSLSPLHAQDISSVRASGAACNGVTDDTAAYDSALATSAVYIDWCPGSLIDGTITIPSKKTLALLPGGYTLGNGGSFVMQSYSSLVCPGGPFITTISVPGTYTVTKGVIALNTGAPAGSNSYQQILGCGISFYIPPGSSTRTGMVQYARPQYTVRRLLA